MKLLEKSIRKIKIITLFSLLTILAATLIFSQPLQADSISYGLEFSYSRIGIKVKDMPLKIRDVPIHSDDSYALRSNAGPIEQREYSASTMLELGFLVKKNITHWLDFGVKLKWILYPYHGFYDNALRNYTNAVGTETRGYGAALTFVGLEMRGMVSSFTPEIMLETPLNKDLILGASLSYYELQAINGWDRYNRLEVKDRYTLTRYYPVSVYLYINNILTIGVQFPNAQNTEIGEEANVESKNTIVFATLRGCW